MDINKTLENVQIQIYPTSTIFYGVHACVKKFRQGHINMITPT